MLFFGQTMLFFNVCFSLAWEYMEEVGGQFAEAGSLLPYRLWG